MKNRLKHYWDALTSSLWFVPVEKWTMSRRSRRSLLIWSAAVVVISGIFLLILPEVARRLAISRLEQTLTVPVRIDNVDVNLFTGRAVLENLMIGRADRQSILTIPRASLEFSRRAALIGDIDLRSISIENPSLWIERLDSQTYNIIQAIRVDPTKPPTKSENETQPVRFAIQKLQMRGGEVVFIDHTQQPDYRLTLSSLDLSAGPIASLPGEVSPTDFTAGVQIAGGTVRVNGSSKLFGETVETELSATVAGVKVSEFGAYLPYGATLELADSTLDGDLRYKLLSKQGKVTQHQLSADLDVGAMALTPSSPDDSAIASLEHVAARNVQIDLLRNAGQVGALVIDKPYMFVRRDAAGLNLTELTPAADKKQAASSANAMPLVIKKVEAKGGTIKFVDQTLEPALNISVGNLGVVADELVAAPAFSASGITVHGRLGSGSLTLTGNMAVEPVRGKFSLTGKSLPFTAFGGYLDLIFTDANFTGDSLAGRVDIALSAAEQDEVAATITGTVRGQNIGLKFPDVQEPFLTSDRVDVAIRTIRLDSNPLVDVDRIAFQGARLEVDRNEAGELNLTRLWAARDGKESKTGTKADTQAKDERENTVAIRSITVNGGNVEIRDLSVSPTYTTSLFELEAKLTDLSPAATRSDIALEGRLGDDANVNLTGWFTPFANEPVVQLHGTIKSYALPPLNPYAAQYLSHRIRQGQITTVVDYTLKANQLQAKAGLVLRDLRLGEKTGDEFAERIGVPLGLAIALLQDASGVIRLQVAMTSETGAKLNVARLIWTAVRNAVVRAITAPFRLVGNILTLGGRIGGISIDPVAFEPGTRELQPQSKKQLEQLAALLKEKPGIELRLSGNVSQDELDDLKQKRFWENIGSAQGKNYQEALINVYRKFGGITQPATPLSSRAEESMEKFVMDRLDLGAEEQKTLAIERARIVEEQLRARGVDGERLSVGAAEKPSGAERPMVQIEVASS
jgi:uncharacterized protein involved in outer membrane biogenesis